VRGDAVVKPAEPLLGAAGREIQDLSISNGEYDAMLGAEADQIDLVVAGAYEAMADEQWADPNQAGLTTQTRFWIDDMYMLTILQLEAQLQAARADIGVARADRLPRITYSVDEGFDTNSLSADQIRQHRGVLATANIDIPIFDWGLTRSRQRQAELRAQSATLQQQLVIRDLYLQFATARQEATTAAERVDNARRALADAERNLTVSISRYRAGEGTITEVTDAQTTLANQRLTLQQALFDYQIARAHLLEAVGQ